MRPPYLRTRALTAATAIAALAPVTSVAKTYTCVLQPGVTQCPAAQGYVSAEPRYGSPNSMPVQNAQVSLDLFDVQPEGADVFTPEGDSDTIGGTFTYGKAGYQKNQRFDGHYQHARRIGEGSRARFLLDVPISVNHVDGYKVIFKFPGGGESSPIPYGGATAVYGTINAGVELPVSQNFLITPRVGYSNLQAGEYFSHDAELVSGSVTARYRLPQVGRGDLILGGMAAYSHTLDTFLSKQPFYMKADYWTLRGGLAYQLPLKARMFGRQSSLRASYVFTRLTGEPFMPYKSIHEAGFSMGVRAREAEQKGRFDQMRVGLLYTHADNRFADKAGYDSLTLTLGYRF
ncbi:hypothetical protein [Novosphingobium colocasiae]|uniref:hypothetical protein n=1 Tax=Novosphingobium colocasiae TaxID=1256513 RepID=UPI0035B3765F